MDTERCYVVYCHENMLNNKRYVGITKQKLSQRFSHGKHYYESAKFSNAIKKYGWDSFNHFVLADNLTHEEACNLEKEYIHKWSLQDDRFGYNIKEGGQGGPITEETKIKIGNANRGKQASPETKKKLSESHKGRKHTEEERFKISKANKGKKKPPEWVKNRIGLKAGEKHPLYGKTLSDETKQKMSESHKKYYETHEFNLEPKRKEVIRIEDNKVYASIESAAQELNICRSSISECCSGKRKSAGGYHWKFVL